MQQIKPAAVTQKPAAVTAPAKRRGRGAAPKTPEEKAAAEKRKREQFEKIGGARVTKSINAIGSFAMLSNRRLYAFDAADVEEAMTAMDEAIKAARSQFARSLSGAPDAAAQTAFSFKKKA